MGTIDEAITEAIEHSQEVSSVGEGPFYAIYKIIKDGDNYSIQLHAYCAFEAEFKVEVDSPIIAYYWNGTLVSSTLEV